MPTKTSSRTAYTETLRPLPYRPSIKLVATSDRPIHLQGWNIKRFRDSRGNFYERCRDGEWERWQLILRRKSGKGRLMFKANLTKSEPEQYGDCLDRIDDLRFTTLALMGLLDDARERGLFREQELDAVAKLVNHVRDRIECMEPAIAEVTEEARTPSHQTTTRSKPFQ